jgi:hypothetical protein
VSPTPEQWRFQWPDGTWIRWNPESETWEKEVPGSDGEQARSEPIDIAPEERWLLDSLEPPSEAPTEPQDRTIAADLTVGPEFAISTESDDEAESDDADEDEGWEEEDGDEIALGPRRSAARVISVEGDEPKSTLRPTIMAGAGIGLAVGIVVSMLLR